MKVSMISGSNTNISAYHDVFDEDNTRDAVYMRKLLSDKDFTFKLNHCGFDVAQYDKSNAPVFLYFLYLFLVDSNKRESIARISNDEILFKMSDFDWIKNFIDKLFERFPS